MNHEDYKYKTLMDRLKQDILERKILYGEKIPSENELAKTLSISRFTVRRAIELLTNEGWLERRQGSGTYVKIENFEKTRTDVVGIITTYFDDYIFPSIIKGAEDVLTANNFAISLGITRNKVERESACLRSMLDQNVAGLIIEGTKSALPNDNIKILQEFDRRKIPVVFINSTYSGFKCSSVLMDDEKSGMMAADYLIHNGHKRIGAIFKGDDIQGHKRYRGFIVSCHSKGLVIEENAMLWYTTEDMEIKLGKEYNLMLEKRFHECTAIVCYNDQIAIRVLEALDRTGRHVPEDISLISFDNSELCEVSSVKLTSISHAREKMGREAARVLLNAMNGNSHVKIILPSELVKRNSVAVWNT